LSLQAKHLPLAARIRWLSGFSASSARRRT
jgi:hypothetical protein